MAASSNERRVMAVDLSHWNTISDWHAVKDAGVIGVMHKATDGLQTIDTTYSERIDPAMSAGLLWGAYHFLQPGPDDEIDAQMDHFIEEVRPWNGMRLAIDYEASGLTLNHLRRACSTLLAKASNPQIAIYGGSLLKGQLGDSKDEYLATFALWLAHYSASPKWPTGTWPVWSLHQYSDGENGPSPKTVPGINSPCDCNMFNGSAENCAAWFGSQKDQGVTPMPGATSIDVRFGTGIKIGTIETDPDLDVDEVIVTAHGAKIWVEA